MDLAGTEDWIREHVEPVGPIETAHEEPWSTVLRVPLADDVVWFKARAPVQGFEPRLTAELFARYPDRAPEVLGHDEQRAWLLLRDAGTPIGAFGNPPEVWLVALPLYAELQLGEAPHMHDHLAHGVPDLRDELVAHDVSETVQHDDLHMTNVYTRADQVRLLDWGDSSISHPFASLVVTFRFLEEFTKLSPGDPWFEQLRGAYLEPWGRGLEGVFALAMRVGTFAHAIASLRQRDHLPKKERDEFDTDFTIVLRRAITQTSDPPP